MSHLEPAPTTETSDALLEEGRRLHDAGDLEGAERSYRAAIEEGDGREAALALGRLYLSAGALAEAEDAFRFATELDPIDVEALECLAVALRHLGRGVEAVELLLRVLELERSRASAYDHLGRTLVDVGEASEAVDCFRRAVSLAPFEARHHGGLAWCLRKLDRSHEALAVLRQTVSLAPHDATMRVNLGIALYEAHDAEGALEQALQAVARAPRLARAHHLLGVVHAARGKVDESAAAWRRAVELDPRCAPAYAGLVRISRFDDEERLAEILASGLDPESECTLRFARATILDRKNRPDEAFPEFEAANRLAPVSFDAEQHAADLEHVGRTFTASSFEAAPERGEGLVFVVGMPRSGSTLVESVIASHPDAWGVGEHPAATQIARQLALHGVRPFPEGVLDLDEDRAAALASQYHQRIGREAGAGVTVDKYLGNFQVLGLIARLFPRARVVHCRRHPLDTCLSAYFTHFVGTAVPYTYDLPHLAAYYEAYRRLMERWREVLPLPVLEVDYEAFVTEPETQARRLVEFCGLDWDPTCLRFFESDRPVYTASHQQVRRPVHTRSVGRWKAYERFLGALEHLA